MGRWFVSASTKPDETGTNALEEERRLAYVAITRARQSFILQWRIIAEFMGSGKIMCHQDF